MLGAIIGDIAGSRFEFRAAPQKDFELFTDQCSYTDDTICTVAIADAVLNHRDYQEALLDWCRRYPDPMGGYGNCFYDWIHSRNPQPMNSFGNGSAMRVSPIGWLFTDWQDVIGEAKKSAEVSHNHPEGIKGAQCTAEVICWLRYMRYTKPDIERKVEKFYGYELPPMKDILKIGAQGHFDGTCQETVPMALRCFMDANDFEETIRMAVLCDGDTDTKACIAGSIAEAYYEIPEWMIEKAFSYLPDDMLAILEQFYDAIRVDINK
ncbi:ADP-ribosylglycohydrolase family protein [Prevotella sp. HUN102]|uniref:ADP-ribosylglycohydrolase family protein n=1 Tax=Prevotella sp. HUN102 TaxID=1392486 RepID=UPI0004905A06|nr:ADP-ribosylglycohydrolase family protein [Prevotella sp. HUN102]